MKIVVIIIILFLQQITKAQDLKDIDSLTVDLNNNGITDFIIYKSNYLELKIDDKKYSYELENIFSFIQISELSFKNNILTISGGNGGTGAWL